MRRKWTCFISKSQTASWTNEMSFNNVFFSFTILKAFSKGFVYFLTFNCVCMCVCVCVGTHGCRCTIACILSQEKSWEGFDSLPVYHVELQNQTHDGSQVWQQVLLEVKPSPNTLKNLESRRISFPPLSCVAQSPPTVGQCTPASSQLVETLCISSHNYSS